MFRRFLNLFSLLVLTSCSSRFFQEEEPPQAKIAFDEMRQELSDVKHALRSTQVSLQILEEKYQNQEHLLTSFKAKNPHLEQLMTQVALLERKMSQVERFEEKVLADLRHLSTYSDQNGVKMQEYEKEIALQKSRLDEVSKLKTTLSSISQVMQQKSKSSSPFKKHKVKSGDTLERIARQYEVSVTSLKKHNQLTSDRIQLGQELEIPND